MMEPNSFYVVKDSVTTSSKTMSVLQIPVQTNLNQFPQTGDLLFYNGNVYFGNGTVWSQLGVAGGGAIFPSISLTNATNQIVFDPAAGFTQTLSVSVPAANRIVTLPDFGGNDTLVGLAAMQTLTNKTLTSPFISYNIIPSTLNGVTNLTAAESGSIITIGQSTTGDATINLPAPASGLVFTFLIIASPDDVHTTTIQSTGANLSGWCASINTGIVAPGSSRTNVAMSATASTVIVGDTINVIGISNSAYIVQGISASSGSGYIFTG